MNILVLLFAIMFLMLSAHGIWFGRKHRLHIWVKSGYLELAIGLVLLIFSISESR